MNPDPANRARTVQPPAGQTPFDTLTEHDFVAIYGTPAAAEHLGYFDYVLQRGVSLLEAGDPDFLDGPLACPFGRRQLVVGGDR
jgi:hypothetical protein